MVPNYRWVWLIVGSFLLVDERKDTIYNKPPARKRAWWQILAIGMTSKQAPLMIARKGVLEVV